MRRRAYAVNPLTKSGTAAPIRARARGLPEKRNIFHARILTAAVARAINNARKKTCV